MRKAGCVVACLAIVRGAIGCETLFNGFTSGDFPSRSLRGLLAGTPQQDYLHSRRRLLKSHRPFIDGTTRLTMMWDNPKAFHVGVTFLV